MKSNLLSGATLAAILFFCATSEVFSQQTVAIGDSSPKTNAILYLKGNGSQGLIIPIVTSLGSFGEAGMVVYNSTDKKIHYHDGVTWTVVGGGTATGDPIVGNEVSAVGSNGALVLTGSGTTASPLTVGMVAGNANGQVLKWNNSTTKWELGTDNTGSVALNSAQILVGNASNVATATTMSGDATLSNAGALTIGNNAVTSAKIADGAIANADVAANAAIAPSKLGQASAANGQVLKWNGSAWAPADDAQGSITLNSAQILVGNASNIPTATTVTGDATLSNTGVLTIAASSVNSSKINDNSITNADIAPSAAIAPSKIGQASATAGQVLKWNGSAWAPASDDGLSNALNNGQILVGSAGNTAIPVSMNGDATITNAGTLTIANNAIGSAEIADNSIVDTDINAAAAIAGTKIWPDFGSQPVSTTNAVTAGNVISTSNAYHYGYTQLGSNSPMVAVVKMTGILSSTSGYTIIIPVPGNVHPTKILSVDVNVQYYNYGYVPANYTTNSGYQFEYYYYYDTSALTTNIVVWPRLNNDYYIVGQPVIIYVTYEQ
jgi:hypothetical protein